MRISVLHQSVVLRRKTGSRVRVREDRGRMVGKGKKRERERDEINNFSEINYIMKTKLP